MKRRTLATGAASIALLIIAIAFTLNHWDELIRTKIVQRRYLVGVAVLMSVRLTLRGLFQWKLMKRLNCTISCRDAIALNYAGAMMNMLLPMPVGAGYRAAFLKRIHNFPYSHFATVSGAVFVYFLSVCCSLGLVAIACLRMNGASVQWGAVMVLLVILVASLTPLLSPKSLSGTGVLTTKLSRVLSGWDTIRSSSELVLSATILVLFSVAISGLALYAAFRGFGIDLGIPGALLLLSSQQVGGLVKLTPGSIGYQEIVSANFASMLSVTTPQTVVVLGTTRLVNIAVTVVVGLPSLWHLAKTGTDDTKMDCSLPISKPKMEESS